MAKDTLSYAVEVILQVDLPDPEEEDRKGRGSVRDKRKEDKALLEMAGRTMNHAQR